MFGLTKREKRNKRLKKVRAIAKRQRNITISDDRLDMLSDAAIQAILLDEFLSDAHFNDMGITSGGDESDDRAPQEMRDDWLREHPEDSTEDEIERDAAEVFARIARIARENARPYEDETMQSRAPEYSPARSYKPDPEPTRSWGSESSDYDSSSSSSSSSSDSGSSDSSYD